MKTLVINALNDRSWIGGLYYKKNIVFSLLQNVEFIKKYRIIIFTNGNNDEVFDEFKEDLQIIKSKFKKSSLQYKEMIIVAAKHKADYIYPITTNIICDLFKIKCISWIPDFQHVHYPQFFDATRIESRNKEYSRIAEGEYLVLSSNDCKKDFLSIFPNHKCKIEVVPFVSYIEDYVKSITEQKEKEVLKKYNLNGKKYVCIMNQFWQHKNHKIVFEAIKKYAYKYEQVNIQFVFTGLLEDFRNPKYIEMLKKIIKEPMVSKYVTLLGFIGRLEQIIIMKNAEFVIQPSLFEGWGTVVEDAKILDKTILLSDIPVHREQKNEKCILFNPSDPDELVSLIEQENAKCHSSSITNGLTSMRRRAEEYSAAFLRLLE